MLRWLNKGRNKDHLHHTKHHLHHTKHHQHHDYKTNNKNTRKSRIIKNIRGEIQLAARRNYNTTGAGSSCIFYEKAYYRLTGQRDGPRIRIHRTPEHRTDKHLWWNAAMKSTNRKSQRIPTRAPEIMYEKHKAT